MLKKEQVLAAATMLLITGTALADEDNRWYATADLGLGSLGSSTLTYSDGTTTSTAEADFEASFVGGGTLGYRFDNGWNLEGEIMNRTTRWIRSTSLGWATSPRATSHR